jgi:hypothetical protein
VLEGILIILSSLPIIEINSSFPLFRIDPQIMELCFYSAIRSIQLPDGASDRPDPSFPIRNDIRSGKQNLYGEILWYDLKAVPGECHQKQSRQAYGDQ